MFPVFSRDIQVSYTHNHRLLRMCAGLHTLDIILKSYWKFPDLCKSRTGENESTVQEAVYLVCVATQASVTAS